MRGSRFAASSVADGTAANDTFAIAGTPDDCRRQLSEWGNLDLTVLFPPTFQLEPDEIAANHRALIETFASG